MHGVLHSCCVTLVGWLAGALPHSWGGLQNFCMICNDCNGLARKPFLVAKLLSTGSALCCCNCALNSSKALKVKGRGWRWGPDSKGDDCHVLVFYVITMRMARMLTIYLLSNPVIVKSAAVLDLG